jgi:lipopolysaccharide biosynthesis regulator YciM
MGVILLLFPVGVSMIGILNSSGLQQNNTRVVSVPAFAVSAVLITLLVFNFNRVKAIWYGNLGVIQMAQVELAGFPTNKWTESAILPDLETAESSLRFALDFDPTNRTVNHRLGLIAMLRRDFDSAVQYLEVAHNQTPNHRGIIKALGYSYVWLGELKRAQILLSEIPEATHELSVYDWWWKDRGRGDLSANAALMVSRLESATTQP